MPSSKPIAPTSDWKAWLALVWVAWFGLLYARTVVERRGPTLRAVVARAVARLHPGAASDRVN